MIRALVIAGLLAIASGSAAQEGVPSAGDEASLSSSRDPARPGFREQPIRCKPGDIEYFAGKSLGDVFGDAWPMAPVGARFERPQVLQLGALKWPAGLSQSGAVVMTAALVGPDGRAVDAHALCATAPAIAKPAVRAAIGSHYAPATFDGVPGFGIAFQVWRFGLRDAESRPRVRPR